MTQAAFANISVEDLHKLSETDTRFLLLDVREDDEFKDFHSPLSRSLPLSRLMEGPGLDELRAPKDEPIYLICRSGRRSQTACELLAAHGFTKPVNVVGGMEAWVRAGLPYARAY